MNRSNIFVGLVIGSAWLFHPYIGWTQNLPAIVDEDAISAAPARDPQDVQREVADTVAWKELSARIKPLEKDNPQQAIDEYRRVFESRPLHPAGGIMGSESIGWLYLDSLKDTKQAENIYQWALKTYDKAPNLYRLSTGRARLLNTTGKFEEAAQLLQQDMEAICQIDPTKDTYAAPAIREQIAALTSLKKPQDLIVALSQDFQDMPALMDGRYPIGLDMYELITNLLIQENRGAEAMGWARLRFAQCVYDTANIRLATQFLIKVWTAAGPSIANTSKSNPEALKTVSSAKSTTSPAPVSGALSSASKTSETKPAPAVPSPKPKGIDGFVAAQKDSALPNPLAEFSLPPVPKRWAKSAVKLYTPAYGHWRINVLIAAGLYGDAMAEAEKLYTKQPESSMGVSEACRVLKAADLNLKSAGDLVKYLKNKEGTDPSIEFYQKYPAQLDEG